MKSLILLFFIVNIVFVSYSQEFLEPLKVNTELYKEETNFSPKTSHTNTFDSTFIYITDTLSLPFFDEFSRNNFQDYEEDFDSPNTTSETYYKLLDEDSIPITENILLTDSVTFRLEVNLIDDTTIFHTFTPTNFLYDPLTSYPVDYKTVNAYPPYIVLDTISEEPTTKDTIWLENPIYFQDSATIFINKLNDPSKLWLNKQAYHNYRFAKKPWSLGVVTFDGLDEKGYPYHFGSSINRTCDTLNSKPIDMSDYAISDSVYFSFLYQPEGYGDPIEDTDSLFLDFYDPVEERWRRVWRVNGVGVTDFQVGHVPVTNPNYFNNGFQFRFMNFCTPAGMLDTYNIDYVDLKPFSGYQDTLFKDFAFVYPISTLLEDYISVPWKHFKEHPEGKMSDEVEVTVRNNSELSENNQDGNLSISYKGNFQDNFTLNGTILSGGQINYAPRTTYISYHDFSNGYIFDTSVNDTMAEFDWIANASAQFPSYPLNDSTFGKQVFRNYYAYDDGTAEKAYGVSGTQSMLAHKFEMYQPDDIIAVQIHFVPTAYDISNNLFLLAVWNDDNGKPGQRIYEDEFFFPKQPKYKYGRNNFATYFFQDTMELAVDEVFYIGFRQIDEERLTIGFDENHNNADKIFWSIDGGSIWNQSQFSGSLMMRPIISSNMNYILNVAEKEKKEISLNFNVYPNPASSYFTVDFDHIQQGDVIIHDINGRMIKKAQTNKQINTYDFDKGIYFVSVIADNKKIGTKKLVIH